MSHDRASRGVPLPTFWQWLVVVAAVGAIALIWMELRRPRTDFGGIGPGDAEEGSIAAALENLRMVEAIAQTGPDGVPELAAALADSNPRLRRNALLALRLMGVEAGEALILVRARLTDEDTQVRSCAIDAYWRICRDPADVAAVVAPMLGDPDGRVRETAAKVLETIGRPAIGPLVALLKTSMPVARIPTLKVLRRIGWDAPQPQIDDVVRNFVRDADPNVSIDALRTLAAWGRTTPSEIAELLQHQDAAERIMSEPNPREAALTAIIRQGSDAAENLNDVLDLLAEDQCGWQQWDLSLAALRAMQSAARPAVPRLLQFANKCQDYRRIDVGWLLLSIGVDPQEIVRMTTPLLLDKDTDLCFHAGRLCAIASPDDARRQVTSLILQLAPEKLAERSSALNAVWGLAREAQEAIPTLSRLLECEQPHVARVAAKALGDIGPEAAPAIPALLAQLARGREVHDYGARSAFCEAIGKMGPAARDAVPALLVELNDAAVSRASAVDINRVEERSFFNEVLSAPRPARHCLR